jgi:hypothetical protein
MRRLLLLLLVAVPIFGESIYPVDDPCSEEPPESLYDKPLCADSELNSALIAAVEHQTGDPSALALLEKRYWSTVPSEERHRIAAVLLRRVPDNSAIWKELFADAELAVRFGADETEAPFEQWCEEHDFYAVRHRWVLLDALAIVSVDPRSHELLVKAIEIDNVSLASNAIIGLVEQRDLASLPAIDAALGRYPDTAKYLASVLTAFGDERADAIVKKYVDEEDPEDEQDVEDQ